MKTSGLAILCAACALLLAQPALAATTHYVSPTGSGTTCSEAAPCALVSAPTGLISGDTILLAPGSYDLGAGSLTVPSGVSLVGADGPRPAITSASAVGATVSVLAGTVKHVAIEQTGGQTALSSGGPSVLEDLLVTSNGNGLSISGGDVLRDSVVRATGAAGTAIQANATAGVSYVRNVLVSAPGANTVGIMSAGICIPMFIDPMNPASFICMPMPTPTIDVRNSIIRAGSSDLATSGGSMSGLINVAYSDYRAAKTSAPTAGTIADGGGNIEGEPLFADAAGGDFHQLPGSPTIDAGDPSASTDAWLGALDFDGLARIVGGRVDIGPDEFVPTGTGTPDTGTGAGTQQPGDTNGGSGNTGAAPGDNTQPVAPAVVDKTAPVIKSLRFAPGLLRKSSLVSYLVSEQSTTTLNVLRKTTGVKKGRTCAAAPRKLKKGAKRCTRWVVVSGSLTHVDRAGKNSFRFNGKLRGKRLKAGSYRLVAVARDAAGNLGRPVTVAFRVR